MTAKTQQRLFGYARVSSVQQELSLQVDALLAHGVEKKHRYCEKISGARVDRPGLEACNDSLRRGNTLVVWRLDRLGRSMRHLMNMIEDLKEREIGFRSISDGMIDTTSASGDRFSNIFSAWLSSKGDSFRSGRLASEQLGHAAAKGGRKPMDPNSPKIVLANKLFCDKSISIQDICSTLKISKTTLYRYV